MIPTSRQEQESLKHLIRMSAQGDQEFSVRAVLCLKPISDSSLVRARQSHYSLYRRMRVIELAMQRPRDGFRKALGVKRLAVDRLILSVVFRKGHPAPPSRSLHLDLRKKPAAHAGPTACRFVARESW